jgi:hypothetical protein
MQLPDSDELTEPWQMILNPGGAVQVLVSTPADDPGDYESWEASCLAPDCPWRFGPDRRIDVGPVTRQAIHHIHYDH